MADIGLVDETLVDLLAAREEQDVYEAAARAIRRLVPGAYVAISRLSLDGEYFSVAETAGPEHLTQPLKKVFGTDLAAATFPVRDMRPQDVDTYLSGRLEELGGGLYRLVLRRFPKPACAAAERLLGITGIYVSGPTERGPAS